MADLSTRSSSRRRGALLAVVVASAFAVAACVAPDPGPVTVGATFTTSDPTVAVAPGTQITVSGAGYNPAGNIGTRFPFLGQPNGVYAVFACVGDPWQPSIGGGSRQVIQQYWVLPNQGMADSLGGVATGAVSMDAQGGFTLPFTLSENGCSGRYAVITYPAGGAAANPGEELEIPVTFAPAA